MTGHATASKLPAVPVPASYAVNPWRQFRENGIRFSLFMCAAVTVITTFGIVIVVVKESVPFFEHVSVWGFLFGTEWTPLAPEGSKSFGVLPLVCGTMLIVVCSSLIAIPIGLASAVYLSEYASARTRKIVKPVLEILAGIPSVVYGFFALVFITPLLHDWFFPEIDSFNALSASIVVAIMVLPLIASLCDDALRAVPNSIRQAGYAVGATKFEVTTRIVVPGALSGVLASVVLAMSRAIGESMAVTLAAGALPVLTANPLHQIQTMTGFIVNIGLGDTPAGSLEYQSIFAVSLLLFAITLGLNVLSNRVLKRFREVYE